MMMDDGGEFALEVPLFFRCYRCCGSHESPSNAANNQTAQKAKAKAKAKKQESKSKESDGQKNQNSGEAASIVYDICMLVHIQM
jgi:hypothetical protein